MKNSLTVAGKTVGILALQGDFSLHKNILEKIGIKSIEVRKIEDLKKINHLIIPGGESTTILKFLEEGWFEPLIEFSKEKSIMGTCAGAIIMAEEVENPKQKSLGIIPIKILRNGYGRQINSFIAEIKDHIFGNSSLEAVFIRAPRIIEIKGDVNVLAKLNGEPVAVSYGRNIALTFHPELTDDLNVHKYFLSI